MLSDNLETLLCVLDLVLSPAPAPAWPDHNSLLPCGDWMWYFHVVLETAFPHLLSMSAPTEQHSPHIPFDLDAAFFFCTSLSNNCTRITHFRTNWLFYVWLCSLEQSVLVLPSPPLILLSLSYTSHLIAAFLSSLPQFLFCLLNNYVFINWGSLGSWERERDVSDRAGGLAEVPCYCGSFIDKPACLSASLPGPEEQPRGAACWWV